MKKMIVLLAALMMTVSFSGMALASDVKGKVTSVKGDTITIEVEKGKASSFSEGDTVEVEAKEKKAPKKGGAMLMGC